MRCLMRVFVRLVVVVAALVNCSAAGPSWTTVLHAADFIAGPDLQKLNTRHKWKWRLNEGDFEVAVRKSALSVPAPQCRMDYVILTMPTYYPEGPAQATLAERQAIYDALLSINRAGKGSLKIRFDALWYSRQRPSGLELTTCNIYFTLPLDKDAAKILP